MTPLAVERKRIRLFLVHVVHPEVESPEMAADYIEEAAYAENEAEHVDRCPRCEEPDHAATMRVQGDECCPCCAHGPSGLIVLARAELPENVEPTVELLRNGRWV